ncbi:MAG: PQQ-binding-like beta-propeller repeat protein [Planctomycetaceae bacterium]|nr:PQQ-binding-like beta-propeller repeat protein [Planctomycetaceae bacterium]
MLLLARIGLSIFALLLVAEPTQAADNWPQFRGPGARGVADGANLPDSWSETQNVAWKADIPGRGWSSPVVWGDQVFLTTCINTGETEEAKKGLYFGGNREDAPTTVHHWKVLCLSLGTGDLIWERTVHEGVPEKSLHIKNSYASETPVTDGEHLYAYFGNVGLFCFDLSGTEVWSKRFAAVETRYAWGTASSPVLHEDRLYLVNDNEESSTLVAYDKLTGDELWRVERDEKSNWATPFVWENDLRTEIITPGTGKTRSYDLDGHLLYEFGGASSITIATPYTAHDLLYVSSGYVLDERKPLWALKSGATGDITLGEKETSNDTIAWCQKMAAPYNPTTLVYGDQLYVLMDRGFFASFDALTGEEVYEQQRIPKGRAFTASPWAADGKIYCLNEYGTTFVFKAGPEYELLATNDLADDEMAMATPAIVGNKLLIRTDARLYCISQ